MEEKEFEDLLDENNDETLFKTEEIKIEEMSIDGICGVY